MYLELVVMLAIMFVGLSIVGYVVGLIFPKTGLSGHQTGMLLFKQTYQVAGFFALVFGFFPILAFLFEMLRNMARYLISLF